RRHPQDRGATYPGARQGAARRARWHGAGHSCRPCGGGAWIARICARRRNGYRRFHPGAKGGPMIRGLAWLLVMTGTMVWAELATAQGRKPKLPAGLDPGGVAIAILSTGIDYRAADIAQRLARDGEGDLIGWDLVDRDNRPFNEAAAETPAALGGDANAL